jgi:hypothetical protein
VGLCPAITTNNKGGTTRAATLMVNPKEYTLAGHHPLRMARQ